MGKIVTFYSYKGGTGRSMVLANVAWALASNGHRILVVDWDLEAPGLHRYFRPFLSDQELTAPESTGLIEFVRNYTVLAATPPAKGVRAARWYEPHAEIWRWATPLRWPGREIVRFGERGGIEFVPAGRQDSEYAERVNTFDWHSLYLNQSGGAFFDLVREKAKAAKEFDFVLIDSRTGVSDTSGICTVQMPDILFLCYTYNLQSIEGARDIARKVRARRPDMTIFPVAMRAEINSSTGFLASMRKFARSRFREFVPRGGEEYFDDMEIPYYPAYSFFEQLAAFEEYPNAKGSINREIRQLAALIADGNVRHVAIENELRRAVVDEFERLPASEETPGKTPERTPIRFGALAWALTALAIAVYIGTLLWRVPSPAKRRATEIVLAASGYGAYNAAATKIGLLLETGDLPETTEGRTLLKEVITAGIPVFVENVVSNGLASESGRLDKSANRFVTCGNWLRVWSFDGKPAFAETPIDPIPAPAMRKPAKPVPPGTLVPVPPALLSYTSDCVLMPHQNRAIVRASNGIEMYEWESGDSLSQAKVMWQISYADQPTESMELSRDGRQLGLVGWTNTVETEHYFHVFTLDGGKLPGSPSQFTWKLPKGESASYSAKLYALHDGFVFTEAPPLASPPYVRLVRMTNPNLFQKVFLPTGLSNFALSSSGTRIAALVGPGTVLESQTIVGPGIVLADIGTDQVPPFVPVDLPPDERISFASGQIVYNPTDTFLALTTPEGFQVRLATDPAKTEWSVKMPGPPGLLGFASVDLDETGNTALYIQAGTPMLFRHDRKPPDSAAPWSDAIRQLRNYTSICLDAGTRQNILLEAAGEAQARYEECEASQGRPVPKASGASGARIASGKR